MKKSVFFFVRSDLSLLERLVANEIMLMFQLHNFGFRQPDDRQETPRWNFIAKRAHFHAARSKCKVLHWINLFYFATWLLILGERLLPIAATTKFSRIDITWSRSKIVSENSHKWQITRNTAQYRGNIHSWGSIGNALQKWWCLWPSPEWNTFAWWTLRWVVEEDFHLIRIQEITNHFSKRTPRLTKLSIHECYLFIGSFNLDGVRTMTITLQTFVCAVPNRGAPDSAQQRARPKFCRCDKIDTNTKFYMSSVSSGTFETISLKNFTYFRSDFVT